MRLGLRMKFSHNTEALKSQTELIAKGKSLILRLIYFNVLSPNF